MPIEVISSLKSKSKIDADKTIVSGGNISSTGRISSGENVTDGSNNSIKKNADAIAAMTPKFMALVPVGSIIPYAGALPSSSTQMIDGFLPCSGQTLSTSSYPELYAVIGRTYTASSVTSSNFQVPSLNSTGRFLRATGTDNALGTVQTDALPNITGAIANAAGSTPEGAFYTDPKVVHVSGFDSGEYGYSVKMDASRSSSIYQNGVNEVRPKSLTVNWLIRAK